MAGKAGVKRRSQLEVIESKISIIDEKINSYTDKINALKEEKEKLKIQLDTVINEKKKEEKEKENKEIIRLIKSKNLSFEQVKVMLENGSSNMKENECAEIEDEENENKEVVEETSDAE